jgi:dTMP kinase
MKQLTDKGLFIALEGIEGSGKSLQAKLLTEKLQQIGYTASLIREPGSTPIGEKIREIILHSESDIPAITELFLFMTARSVLIEQFIKPQLESGNIVVADRFHLSSLAYQGAGRRIPYKTIDDLGAKATSGIQPDMTILVDIPYEVGKQRQVLMGKSADRIENESSDFHNRVRDGYKELATRIPNIVTIDGNKPIEMVTKSIMDKILPILTR